MTADPDAQDAAFAAALAAAGTAAASVRRRRDYPLLLAGQFLGAFGDNALLAVIVGPLLFRRQSGELTEAALRDANTFYTALLFVPCVLFAPLAGYAGDRFSKNRLLVGANAIKLAGAALCAAGALLPAPVAGADPRFGSAGALLLGAGYFCVGAGTCFYGPAKYGALPEILPREKLVRGNGTVEMLTLLAVLGGFIAGSAAADVFRGAGDAVVPHLGVLGIFGVSLALNAAMSRLPNNPAVRLAATAGAFFGHARDLLVRAPRTRLLLCGTMAFWLVGAAMKTHFQPWGQGILGLSNNTEISLLALVLSVGVMAGSVLAGRLHGVGDLRATPRYALLLAAVLGIAWSVGGGGVLEFWTSPASRVTAGGLQLVLPVDALLFAAGVFAGLFLIPLNAALQAETDPAKMGKTIAVQNLCDYLGMLLAAALLFGANAAGASPRTVFLALGGFMVLVAAGMKFGDATGGAGVRRRRNIGS